MDGYAIGGLAVGETHEQMYHILDVTVPELPQDKPIYLMGVGTPQNILEAVERGVDFFDCVYPARNGRHEMCIRDRRFTGSKYVKSNPKTIYRDIERKLKDGKKVLFIGLPCQVAALRNFSSNQENLYTVDLICHVSPSPELLKMYLKEKSVDIEELEELNFREKTSFGLRSTEKDIGFSRIVDMYTYCLLYTSRCV